MGTSISQKKTETRPIKCQVRTDKLDSRLHINSCLSDTFLPPTNDGIAQNVGHDANNNNLTRRFSFLHYINEIKRGHSFKRRRDENDIKDFIDNDLDSDTANYWEYDSSRDFIDQFPSTPSIIHESEKKMSQIRPHWRRASPGEDDDDNDHDAMLTGLRRHKHQSNRRRENRRIYSLFQCGDRGRRCRCLESSNLNAFQNRSLNDSKHTKSSHGSFNVCSNRAWSIDNQIAESRLRRQHFHSNRHNASAKSLDRMSYSRCSPRYKRSSEYCSGEDKFDSKLAAFTRDSYCELDTSRRSKSPPLTSLYHVLRNNGCSRSNDYNTQPIVNQPIVSPYDTRCRTTSNHENSLTDGIRHNDRQSSKPPYDRIGLLDRRSSYIHSKYDNTVLGSMEDSSSNVAMKRSCKRDLNASSSNRYSARIKRFNETASIYDESDNEHCNDNSFNRYMPFTFSDQISYRSKCPHLKETNPDLWYAALSHLRNCDSWNKPKRLVGYPQKARQNRHYCLKGTDHHPGLAETSRLSPRNQFQRRRYCRPTSPSYSNSDDRRTRSPSSNRYDGCDRNVMSTWSREKRNDRTFGSCYRSYNQPERMNASASPNFSFIERSTPYVQSSSFEYAPQDEGISVNFKDSNRGTWYSSPSSKNYNYMTRERKSGNHSPRKTICRSLRRPDIGNPRLNGRLSRSPSSTSIDEDSHCRSCKNQQRNQDTKDRGCINLHNRLEQMRRSASVKSNDQETWRTRTPSYKHFTRFEEKTESPKFTHQHRDVRENRLSCLQSLGQDESPTLNLRSSDRDVMQRKESSRNLDPFGFQDRRMRSHDGAPIYSKLQTLKSSEVTELQDSSEGIRACSKGELQHQLPGLRRCMVDHRPTTQQNSRSVVGEIFEKKIPVSSGFHRIERANYTCHPSNLEDFKSSKRQIKSVPLKTLDRGTMTNKLGSLTARDPQILQNESPNLSVIDRDAMGNVAPSFRCNNVGLLPKREPSQMNHLQNAAQLLSQNAGSLGTEYETFRSNPISLIRREQKESQTVSPGDVIRTYIPMQITPMTVSCHVHNEVEKASKNVGTHDHEISTCKHGRMKCHVHNVTERECQNLCIHDHGKRKIKPANSKSHVHDEVQRVPQNIVTLDHRMNLMQTKPVSLMSQLQNEGDKELRKAVAHDHEILDLKPVRSRNLLQSEGERGSQNNVHCKPASSRSRQSDKEHFERRPEHVEINDFETWYATTATWRNQVQNEVKKITQKELCDHGTPQCSAHSVKGQAQEEDRRESIKLENYNESVLVNRESSTNDLKCPEEQNIPQNMEVVEKNNPEPQFAQGPDSMERQSLVLENDDQDLFLNRDLQKPPNIQNSEEMKKELTNEKKSSPCELHNACTPSITNGLKPGSQQTQGSELNQRQRGDKSISVELNEDRKREEVEKEEGRELDKTLGSTAPKQCVEKVASPDPKINQHVTCHWEPSGEYHPGRRTLSGISSPWYGASCLTKSKCQQRSESSEEKPLLDSRNEQFLSDSPSLESSVTLPPLPGDEPRENSTARVEFEKLNAAFSFPRSPDGAVVCDDCSKAMLYNKVDEAQQHTVPENRIQLRHFSDDVAQNVENQMQLCEKTRPMKMRSFSAPTVFVLEEASSRPDFDSSGDQSLVVMLPSSQAATEDMNPVSNVNDDQKTIEFSSESPYHITLSTAVLLKHISDQLKNRGSTLCTQKPATQALNVPGVEDDSGSLTCFSKNEESDTKSCTAFICEVNKILHEEDSQATQLALIEKKPERLQMPSAVNPSNENKETHNHFSDDNEVSLISQIKERESASICSYTSSSHEVIVTFLRRNQAYRPQSLVINEKISQKDTLNTHQRKRFTDEHFSIHRVVDDTSISDSSETEEDSLSSI